MHRVAIARSAARTRSTLVLRPTGQQLNFNHARPSNGARQASSAAAASADPSSSTSAKVVHGIASSIVEDAAPLPVRPLRSANPPPVPSTSHRLVIASLLCRSPLVLPPLSPFERAYFAYQREIRSALEKSAQASWFFREGSRAEKTFLESLERGEGKRIVHGVDVTQEDAVSETPEAKEEAKRAAAIDRDEKDLERKKDRTLYLMVKKRRKEHQWQFPQGGLEPNESLASGALRELYEECGPNLDVWSVGKVPAAHFAYKGVPKAHEGKGLEGTKVWYMPQRLLRGQAKITELGKKEGLTDFAWLTREEIEARIPKDMWEAIEPALSP